VVENGILGSVLLRLSDNICARWIELNTELERHRMVSCTIARGRSALVRLSRVLRTGVGFLFWCSLAHPAPDWHAFAHGILCTVAPTTATVPANAIIVEVCIRGGFHVTESEEPKIDYS
jgi:hypothetical protein